MFKFGFTSTKSTFEVTGCGLVVIAGERENTHLEVVVAALVLTALPSGKGRKSLVTSLLQQGSTSLRLVAVAYCYNCFLRFDLELADVHIASFSFNSSIWATARDCFISTSHLLRRNSASARLLSASACACSSSRLNSFCFHCNAIMSCLLAMDDAEDLFNATLHISLAEPSLSVHSCTNCSYFCSLINFLRCKLANFASASSFSAWYLQCMAPRKYTFYKLPSTS